MPSRDFFIYSAEFLPLGAGATAVQQVSIQGDSNFELTALTGDVRDADSDEAVIAQPAILINLRDQGAGRYVFDRAQIWDNIIGTAERPFVLPMPKMFTANSVLSVECTNNIAGVTKRVRIALIGYKHFPSPTN